MTNSVGDYLNRLARALLDDSYQDDDPWIARRPRAVRRWHRTSSTTTTRPGKSACSWRTASRRGASPSTRAPTAHRALSRRQPLFLGIRGIRFRQGRQRRLRVHQAGAQIRQRDGDGQRGRRRNRRRRCRGNLGAGHRAVPLRGHRARRQLQRDWKARSRCPIPSTTRNGITRSSSSARPGPRCWKSAPRPATCRSSTPSPRSTSAKSIA